jgi:hypothetical protein
MRQRILLLGLLSALAACLDENAVDGAGGGLDPDAPGAVGGGDFQPGFYLGPKFAMFFSAAGDAVYVTGWRGLVDQYDIQAAAARDPANAGKWRTGNGKLTIKWGDANQWVTRLLSTSSFEIESGRKNGIGTIVSRPPSVPPTLVGSFKRGRFDVFGVDNTGTGSGATSSDHWLNFNADGTVAVVDEVGVYLGGQYLSDIKKVVGQFEVDGFTMTITEANGNVTRHNLWISDGAADNPTMVAFDGSEYLRQ